VNRAIDDQPGIQQDAICCQRFKQRLILSVSKPQTYLQRPSPWGRATAECQDVENHSYRNVEEILSTFIQPADVGSHHLEYYKMVLPSKCGVIKSIPLDSMLDTGSSEPSSHH